MSTVWLIPAFPLAGALVNMVFGRVIGRSAHWIAVPALVASFLGSCVVFARVWSGQAFTTTLFTWIVAADFETTVVALVDPLTGVMLLVVTGVGMLIHVYSIGYMHDDPGYARFFAYLNLFVFSMTMLVLAGNFLLLYVFWEAVGLCSYLLIGFWYTRDSAAQAGKKAFIVNRVGDFGFGLAIMWIWIAFGTLDYVAVFKGAETLAPATATGIALLLFMGACGKSAQVPLHVWLPDAMEGPTPVSALIHAATMVTAGVYIVARSHALFERSTVALDVVLWVGVITAVFAATIGLVQTDIKRVLAYSTVSQLGYMFAALGLGAYTAGIFHLVTHAFFKALLFLGAGSVIHGLHGEQDLRKMGALAPRMRVTAMTMTIGALGLVGFPGLAGFFSKDEILAAAFFGSGIPSEHGTPFARFLSPVLPVHEGEHGGAAGVMLLVLSVIVVAAGILLAWFMYMAAPVKAETIGQPRTVLVRLLLNAWYVDWLYDRAIVRPLYALSVFLARVFDLGVIDGLVNGLGRAVVWWSAGLRRLQTGYVVNYALTMLAGAVIFVAYFLAR